MSIIEVRVGGRFRLKHNLSAGSFAEIYLAQNVQTREEVAVKLEDKNAKYPQLIYEAKILFYLQGGIGIPHLIWCGEEGDYHALIIELLGDSLETLFNRCRRKLSLKTVLMIADQTLQTIEHVHNRGFLHRDIRPENLLIGLDNNYNFLHLIDYGLAKRYKDPKTGNHIPYREDKRLMGTATYVSINTHEGKEQSRRDDLEALGYLYVYLYKGSLPWLELQDQPYPDKNDKNFAVFNKKKNTTLKELCAGMPVEFLKYLEYCRNLKFDEKPDYGYLRRAFKELFISKGFELDHVYDWTLIPLGLYMDMDEPRVDINLNFSLDDGFMNKNICNIEKLQEELSPKPSTASQEPAEEQPPSTEKIVEMPVKRQKPKPKPIQTEYLRTDCKVNTLASPSNMRSPGLLSAQKKANVKDCNMF